MTNSEPEAKKIEEKLAKVPEVLRTMSLDSFVPEDQPAKLKLIARAPSSTIARSTRTRLMLRRPTPRLSSFERSAGNLRNVAGDQRGRCGGVAAACRRAVKAPTPIRPQRDKTQAIFVSPLKIMLDQLTNSLQAQPVNLKTLRRSGEFVENQGWPDRVESTAARDPTTMTPAQFAAAVLTAEPNAIGGPVRFSNPVKPS